GIDTRIGYPNEHIAGDSAKVVARPLYATGVGLTMESDLNNSRSQIYVKGHENDEFYHVTKNTVATQAINSTTEIDQEHVVLKEKEIEKIIENETEKQSTVDNIKGRFFGNFLSKFKEFIDKSE